MNVYYIGGNYESCYYVRCLIPLHANLWNGEKTSLGDGSDMNPVAGMMNADIIVFHRPMTKDAYELATKLKAVGKKIVLDNDDTYKRDSGVPIIMSRMLQDPEDKLEMIDTQLKDFAKLADMVTVTTEFLKDEYKEVNDNVVVLKNCVDKRDWYKPVENDTGKVRIGIVGSVASNKDYEPITQALESLKGREDVQLVLFALPPKNDNTKLAVELYKPEFDYWSQYNPEWHHFVPMKDYTKTLRDLKLDIALIPRYDNYFNRCKSNLKFLEMSMLKVPVIAQGFSDGMSPYQVDTQDAEHMIICDTPEEWTKAITDIIDNKQKRKDMGEKAYNYVLEKYEINNNKHLWREAYQTIWNQNES